MAVDDASEATPAEAPAESPPVDDRQCRVCRGEATPEAPLFYPCHCSGSIKYVHEDCLVEWLRHSGKRSCELCKHPYAFSPILRPEAGPDGRLTLWSLLCGLADAARRHVAGVASGVFQGLLLFVVLPSLTGVLFDICYWQEIPRTIQGNVEAYVFGAIMQLFVAFVATHLAFLASYLHRYGFYRLKLQPPVVPVPSPPFEDAVSEADTAALSVVSAAPSHVSHSAWLQSVTPREYRAYLRRRDLARARRADPAETIEANAWVDEPFVDDHAASATVNPPPSETLDDSTSVASSVTSLRQAPSDAATGRTGSTDAARRRAMFSTRHGSVLGRDSFRCRICGSSVCTLRQHVIAASAGHSLASPTEESAEALAQPAAEQPQQLPAETPEQPARQQQAPAAEEELIVDVADRVFFDDDQPARRHNGPMRAIYRTVGHVFICHVIWFLFMRLPRRVGGFLLDGSIPHVARKLWSLFDSIVGPPASEASDAAFLRASMQKVGSGTTRVLDACIPNASKQLSYVWSNILATIGTTIDITSTREHLIVGWIVIGTLVCLTGNAYLKYNILRRRNLDQTERCVATVIVTTNAACRAVALYVLYLGCATLLHGITADIALLPLWGATWPVRLDSYRNWPVLSQVALLLAGIAVVAHIAFAVRWCRAHLRPGVLHFIGNPEDSEGFADLLRQPLIPLLARQVFFTLAIASVLAAFLRTAVILTTILAPRLVPLDLGHPFELGIMNTIAGKASPPIAYVLNLPFELLAHVSLRVIVHVVGPLVASPLLSGSLRVLSRVLRLSSLMYGGRYVTEEKRGTGRFIFVPATERRYSSEELAGAAQRTPDAYDIAQLPVVEGRRTPPAPAAAETAETEANDVPRRPRTTRPRSPALRGFTVVYIPSYVRLRLLALGVGSFLVLELAALFVFTLPLAIGRMLVYALLGDVRNDLAAYAGGLIILWGILAFARNVSARFTASQLLRLPLCALHFLAVSLIVLFVWPLVFMFDLTFVIGPMVLPLVPSRLIFTDAVENRNMASIETLLVCPFLFFWTSGLVIGRSLFELRPLIPQSQLTRYLNALCRGETWWPSNAASAATTWLRLIVPVTFYLTRAVYIPQMIASAFALSLSLSPGARVYMTTWAPHIALAGRWTPEFLRLIQYVYNGVMTGVRNEVLVVGQRLHNVERADNA